MSQLRTILSCFDRPRDFHGTQHERFTRHLQDLLRNDLLEDPVFRDHIILAGHSIRANLLEKWEDTRNTYHLRLNPPTATLCPLVGPEMGQFETVGLQQLIDFLHRHESKAG